MEDRSPVWEVRLWVKAVEVVWSISSRDTLMRRGAGRGVLVWSRSFWFWFWFWLGLQRSSLRLQLYIINTLLHFKSLMERGELSELWRERLVGPSIYSRDNH